LTGPEAKPVAFSVRPHSRIGDGNAGPAGEIVIDRGALEVLRALVREWIAIVSVSVSVSIAIPISIPVSVSIAVPIPLRVGVDT
jgi:hypothetical protein